MKFNSIQFNSIQFNSIQFNSIQFKSNQIKSNQIKSKITRFSLVAFFLLNTFSVFSFPKLVELHNCYQQIIFDGQDDEYNLLNGEFWFHKNGPTNFDNFLTLKAFDQNGLIVPLDWVDIGLTDGVTFPIYPVSEIFDFNTQSVVYADVIDMRNFNNGVFNTNMITLPSNVKSFEIIILNPGSDYDFVIETKSTVNILTLEDAFTLTNSNGQDCQTFDNFNMSYVNNLDGFCGSVKGKLRRLPSDITDPADPLNELGFVFSNQSDLSPWAEHCLGPDQDIIIEPRPNEPVPWGCQTFVMELIIEPCWVRPVECEDLIISEEIEICCTCDARQQLPAH